MLKCDGDDDDLSAVDKIVKTCCAFVTAACDSVTPPFN